MAHEVDTSAMVASLAEMFVVCKSGSEYCRSIVMDPLIGKHAVGSQLFTVNQDGNLINVSNFGKAVIPSSQSLSIWDDNLICSAVRDNIDVSGEVTNPETDETFYVFAYPYRSPANPVGLVVMVKTENWAVVLPENEQRTLSLMGALWLEALGIESKGPSNITNGTPQPLTPRQMSILQGMAEGKTNAEIAVDLILSESSIRQETVRIYRSLGVGNRQDAVKRAVHQGMIARVAV